jgi:hypothetical protein
MGRKFIRLLVLLGVIAAMLILSIPAAQAKNTVKLNKTKATLYVGETLKLNLTGTDKAVTWTTSKKSVATVTSTGKVKAKKEGSVTITAKAAGKKYRCKVTVKEKTENNIVVTVGQETYTITLYENETARQFAKLLPLTIDLKELNGNEKYGYLSKSLTTEATKPAEIKKGDLMLYGSDCLVLFYESFSTAYSYTPLGRIDNPEGLETALGKKDIKVTFQYQ